MSFQGEETIVHIDNDLSKENNSLCELTSDSGIETLDSCSAAFPISSDSEISPIKHFEEAPHVNSSEVVTSRPENESGTSLSIPVTNSPFDSEIINVMGHDKSLFHENVETEISSTVNENYDLCKNHIPHSNIDDLGTQPESNLNTSILATSSSSLNEQKTALNNNSTICKSPLSKSVENISTVEHQAELNTEKILAEFTNKKSKVGAVQKIPETSINQNVDVKYPRIPKEILSQDLGSIVKNVHGIFSSVSGSLKSAYNSTQRVAVSKPVPKNLKPLTNGKVMNEIFEDEISEEKPYENGVDKVNENDVTNVTTNSSDQGTIDAESDTKRDLLRLQVESLERVLGEQRRENAALRDRLKQQLDEIQEKDQMFKDFEIKLDLMNKRVDQAEREKDAAVMRYASVECAAIEAKRAAEKATQAERAAATEVELLNGKLKSAHSEKQRICQLYDDKCHELATSEREMAKIREETRELEGRLKWTQSKLRVEMDAYKESAERVEKLKEQVAELEVAKEAAVANAADTIRAKQLEAELKESQAALIMCRHEKEELDRRLTTITQQFEVCKRERDSASSALASSTAEVEQLKHHNLRLEEEAAELAALRAQAALADTLSAQLQRECERARSAEEARARSAAAAETCGRREAAALEHAARLTAQHVRTRDRAAQAAAKVAALAADNSSLRERAAALQAEEARLQAALADEVARRHSENKLLARKVAELTEEVAEVSKKLEWEKGENGVIKKKHASAIKELNRELQRALKRCEQLEAKLPPPDAPSTRTGSVSSLSSGENAPAVPEDRLHDTQTDGLPDIQVREPDRQTLIERIVSLQRAAARRAERCEFLEEHSRQLTAELRTKSRLLRHLLCSLPAGTVTSDRSDMNKKEIARLGGGAMAAVWGGATDGMTLELSLEMNRRLQAVLEDTLLKNITLKENMDTLGAEISRLKEHKTNTETK
ncbi:coiled-coil domain-containing protein 186 isoform X2 [Galleria mellonella]|uniref:Coiled-coil domain-containing protein 186 isoform X2 n=1 Tax=Galleria mellonella TaxID=7137 RepID=A0ABM3MR80_GALME|nr:coiled-coil domain-containing protein 186 isoform X2 [Galleria mellonella]